MFIVTSSDALLALVMAGETDAATRLRRTHAQTNRLGVHLNARSRTTTRSSKWRSRELTAGVVDLLYGGFSTANN